MSLQDPIEKGLMSGWRIDDLTRDDAPALLEADVVIVGTGAGGGTAAEILSRAGLSVLMIEEGGLHHQKDFKLDELWAFGNLYQEANSRTTADAAISILQGKSVGGSTTINWTSSFRTPEPTLNYWKQQFGVLDIDSANMAPWFQDRENRLNIAPWAAEPNANNSVLQNGGRQLGWNIKAIPRNVKACWNLGYCGFGCPTNAKQSMLVTSIPDAMNAGGRLLTRASVSQLLIEQGQIAGLDCVALDAGNHLRPSRQCRVKGRHYILSAGAIGSPAILLRSEAPDPYGLTGKRTFLHPVVANIAEMPEKVDPFYGAPQSIYTDEFNWRDGNEGKLGFKLEVPPLHPAMAAGVLGMHGEDLRQNMERLPYINSVLALMRDGFHEESPGGEVKLKDNGRPVVDYPLNDYLWDGVREAYLQMAECQFAAGAKRVRPLHLDSGDYRSWSEAREAIRDLPLKAHRVRLFSAHVMGGCTMGENSRTSVVNSFGRHHHLNNLSVMDGSVFPTSIGANPQLSIYGLVARNASRLAAELTG